MFVLWKIWHPLFSCYLRFEIRPFALLPTKQELRFFVKNRNHMMGV